MVMVRKVFVLVLALATALALAGWSWRDRDEDAHQWTRKSDPRGVERAIVPRFMSFRAPVPSDGELAPCASGAAMSCWVADKARYGAIVRSALWRERSSSARDALEKGSSSY